MVKFYVMKIKDGTITIEDVPERWRANVEEAIKEE
ncbi:CD1375 family protein [Mediterraneibacter glycyrrhizinilyticus]|nr:CD1375 family protein [Mediterraneibacter glycyrrhizinilyticus]